MSNEKALLITYFIFLFFVTVINFLHFVIIEFALFKRHNFLCINKYLNMRYIFVYTLTIYQKRIKHSIKVMTISLECLQHTPSETVPKGKIFGLVFSLRFKIKKPSVSNILCCTTVVSSVILQQYLISCARRN